MPVVRVIPARQNLGGEVTVDFAPRVRVAAYCRVSTDSDEQATSYETQIEHYTEFIKKNPEWEFAGIYADDGISGTNTQKRDEFNRLIDDCMDGKIGMVVTKSISRFARNTLDCLKYIRQLKEKNIAVYFEKESINTLDAKGELLITIMASLAQQESQSISQNVRLGLQYRYQQGKVQVCTNRFLGYDKDEDGKLIINVEEAKIVKRIFREFLEGSTYLQIGKGLMADGIKTAAGSEVWLTSTIKKMLQNEKYMGDALLQKTVTTDFLTKKRVANKGLVPQYYVEDSHEPIIPKDLFLRVQDEIVRRTKLVTGTGKRRVYSGKYALSSIVFCSHCGDVFQRTHWNIHGKKKIVWRCSSRLHKKDRNIDCPARTISEETLQEVAMTAINRVLAEKDSYIPKLKKGIKRALAKSNDHRIAEIDTKLEALQKELLEKIDAKESVDVVAEWIDDFKEEKHKLQLEDANKQSTNERILELEKFVDGMINPIAEYDEELVRQFIEKIIVYDEYFEVILKSGVKVRI